MKVGTAIAAGGLALVALAATYWLGRREPMQAAHVSADSEITQSTSLTQGVDAASTTSASNVPSGPQPKCVVDETSFEFGVMALGEKRSHKFMFRNEGDAPLTLTKGKTTCKCTISKVADGSVPPGGSVEVELEWEPKEIARAFRQSAEIVTNEPTDEPSKTRSVHLEVVGRVEAFFRMEPSRDWAIGELAAGEPTVVVGGISSATQDQFKIFKIESSNPLVTVESRPLTPDELAAKEVKSGYEVKVTISPDVPIGSLTERLTIHTDIVNHKFQEKETVIVWDLRGTKAGPVRFVNLAGTRWYAESSTVSLGRFQASEGKKGTLLMFVTGMPGGQELVISDIECSPAFITFTSVRDEEFQAQGRSRYRLTFEVPAGSPAASHPRTDVGKVRLKTNHPNAPEIEFGVEFISF